jgi:GT2 family glycosyltransferase
MESDRNQSQPLVSVLTLTWNSEDSIEGCLRGVAGQTYPDLEIITTDNNSHDRTREVIEGLKPIFTGTRSLVTDWRDQNYGYGEGRNSGIRLAKGKYVLCLNDDVLLEDDFIEIAVATMERDDRIGAVQGKLLQAKNHESRSRDKTESFVAVRRSVGDGGMNHGAIDTTGLVAHKSRHFANRGHGKEYVGQYEKEGEVFGVDGAAPVYRRAALEDVRIPNTNYEYFDSDFFLYKEDIDLSWRLRLAGWKIVYQPKARAVNTRTSKTGLNFFEARFQTSRRVRYFSFRNHHLLMLKNDGSWFFFKHLPWILARECGYLLISLIFELGNVVAIRDIIKLLPRMLRKRRFIMAKRRVKWGEIYKWFK